MQLEDFKDSPPKTQQPKLAPLKTVSPPVSAVPLKKEIAVPVQKVSSPPKKENPSPPKREDSLVKEFPPPPKKNSLEATSPPVSAFKLNRADSTADDKINPKLVKEDALVPKEVPIKSEKPTTVVKSQEERGSIENNSVDTDVAEAEKKEKIANEESNGVGDKIKKFEKAAEDASANVGRMSRPGSVRGRSRTERLGSDSKEELPPPATPFKDNVQMFEIANSNLIEKSATVLERQQSLSKGNTLKWQRSDSNSNDVEKVKPEPQKIIKPEFKPIASPVEVTIRSPSLGSKLPDQFPSHGTAFRNVASPDPARQHKLNDDVNTQNNIKVCKLKNKEKYSVSKGSSYFTRGSEEIWLVKKKDIEEIEERVLDSFRRAGGNVCMRSESMRPSSDSGQASFTHATMGRTKRQMYARSESLDPQWAGARAQTLKRQSSVACTCGHDKKTRAKSADTTPRPRSRSHGDDNNQAHVLDKYETLV